MSKLRPVLLLIIASVMLTGCIVIESEHLHHHTDTMSDRP